MKRAYLAVLILLLVTVLSSTPALAVVNLTPFSAWQVSYTSGPQVISGAPGLMYDTDTNTKFEAKWSGEIIADLGSSQDLAYIEVWESGPDLQGTISLYTSTDGVNYTAHVVNAPINNGPLSQHEGVYHYQIEGTTARYIKLVITEGAEPSSINEITILSLTSGGGDPPPAQPTGLTATATAFNQVQLSWTANNEPDISGYRIYRDGIQVAEVTGTSWTDNGVTGNSTYTYTIRAVDTAGNVSNESNPATVTTPEEGGGDPPPGEGTGGTIRDLVDSITGSAIQMLQDAFDRISSITLVAARGLNLDYFLGPVSMLGTPWVNLITSIVASIILIATVFVVRAIYNLYLRFKEGVRWW